MAAVDTSAANGYSDDPINDNVIDDHGSEDDADLFGDDDEAEQENENSLTRKLDDSELDSGDDEGRADRVAATVEDEDIIDDEKELKLLNTEMVRVKPPEGDELYLLNMPPFLGIKHRNFDPATFNTPSLPHDGRDPEVYPESKFSPFSTAASTVYWRRDPKNPELLQSNSRIIRWSDGSLTLQIASTPKDHYRISTTALRQSFGHKQKGQPLPEYDPNKDTHNYLAAPHGTPGIDLQIIAPLDAAMRIQPTGDLADESVLKLQQSLAAATQMHDPLASLKQVTEDPELAKKAAEMFEKDRMRTVRKREAAEDRLLLRKDRVLGRSGFGRSGAGLSVAGLEDDDGMPTARGTKTKKRRTTNRRGDIYSDDEDPDMPRHTREDEYDREDDFLAASDEEPEIYDDGDSDEPDAEAEDDDPDVDDLEIEGRNTVIDNRTRRDRGRDSTPKRSLDDEDEDEAQMAPAGSPQARKKRRVIDDDDDEE